MGLLQDISKLSLIILVSLPISHDKPILNKTVKSFLLELFE